MPAAGQHQVKPHFKIRRIGQQIRGRRRMVPRDRHHARRGYRTVKMSPYDPLARAHPESEIIRGNDDGEALTSQVMTRIRASPSPTNSASFFDVPSVHPSQTKMAHQSEWRSKKARRRATVDSMNSAALYVGSTRVH
jgi:hypothetical protein